MSNIVSNTEIPTAVSADVPIPPTGMHRPGHCALDTTETAALDEVQHETALRDSALRPPR